MTPRDRYDMLGCCVDALCSVTDLARNASRDPVVLSRRELVAGCVGVAAALSRFTSALAADLDRSTPLGVVNNTFTIRGNASRTGPESERLDDPLAFLELCHKLGVPGIQTGLGTRDAAHARQLRQRAEAYGMYLEGTIRLPRDRSDVDRFANDALAAKEAGATVLRTVMLSGRRYETFETGEAFRRFAEDSYRSLTLAEPVVARQRLRLAVENHKDWLAAQLVDILKRIGSEFVGVCLDTGNNVALLEDPMEVVNQLAPWAFTTHIKDMGVREYDQGFLLAEVPLGEGFLDLPKVFRTLRAARPGIHFNLEMITRDPLKVPCLTPKYWATFEDRPARELARMLTIVRSHASKTPLAEISGLPAEGRLKAEDENVRRSLAYAADKLS